MSGDNTRTRLRGIYILPVAHVCVCAIALISMLVPRLSHLGLAWSVLIVTDFPVSIVAFMLGWKHGLLAQMWLVGGGTGWWYLIGVGVARLFGTDGTKTV